MPAFLNKREQKLIFSPKQKNYLKENPTTVELGGEEIELQWMNRLTDRPARQKLIKQALDAIFESNDGKDWRNLEKLLQALKEVHKKPLAEKLQDKIVRKAFDRGQINTVLQILQHVDRTGMSLKSGLVLRTLVMGLRDSAQKSGWEREHLRLSLERLEKVKELLESEDHGAGGIVRKTDPRRSPFVLGVQLELVAIYAFKHNAGVDSNDTVSRYADRLLSTISEDHALLDRELALEEKAVQWRFQQAIPILHGVFIANKILGEKMPQAEKARHIIADYESRLNGLASVLEGRQPEKGSYDHTALEAWRRMIRD